MSQEELATKLNVSRQSVSKWESNNTYPETDKIIQICNIFNCSMDNLINENIKDINEEERSIKNNFNIVIDSLLDFITRTINMLSSMRFVSILRCIIEQLIIGVILIIAGVIIVDFVPTIICHIVTFLPQGIYSLIYNLIKGIIEILWLIISVIAIVHIFKIRYLNYYEESEDNKEKEKDNSSVKKVIDEEDSKVPQKKIKQDPKIIIRDPKHEPFAFLSVLSKLVISIIKIATGFIGLFFAFTLVFAIVGLVLSIYLAVHSFFFVGISLSALGAIAMNVLIVLLLLYFIVNKKLNLKISIITFFISIVVIGLGLGISLISFKDFKFIDSSARKEKLKEYNTSYMYQEDMILSNSYPHGYKMMIDNSMVDDAIVVKSYYDPDFEIVDSYKFDNHGMQEREFYFSFTNDFGKVLNLLLKDLKNNTIRRYNLVGDNTDMEIVANEKTVSKLMENYSKIYLYSKTEIEGGYIISNVTDKIESGILECFGTYNAKDNTISCSEDCECEIVEKETFRGNKIYYTCKNKES